MPGVLVYRKLRGEWRKSCWPVAIFASKTEDGEIYQKAFQATKSALTGLGLEKAIRQVHLDWFPGSKTAAKAVFAHCRIKRGMEHLRRNLRKNQASANRKKKRPGAKAAAAKAKAKAGAKRRVARPEAEPPHIKRSIYAVLNVLAELMWSPTATYLDVCLELFLSRVANVWEEPRFCEYFIQTYCQKHAVEQSVYGQPEIWMPEWWSGVAAQRAGFLSSQQPAEEINCSPDA